jgi:hypothetical protein
MRCYRTVLLVLLASASAQPVHGQTSVVPTAAEKVPLRGVAPIVLPGTRASAFATVQGNALNSTNGALPNHVVRLRDARMGRIVDTQNTDQSGLFMFRTVDPGTYIVELTVENRVIAASQLLNADAGTIATAVVKLPFRAPPFAGLLGHSLSHALAVTSAAAASGVLAANVTGEDVSPR